MDQGQERTMQALIDEAWALHPDDAAAAAQRVQQAATQLDAADAAQADALLRCAEHVLLGHLADLPALAALLERCAPAATGRGRAAIALTQGLAPDWQDLAPAEQVRAHYNAALARSRSRDFAAMRRLMAAAQAAVPAGDAAAAKAWAATANNIAADMRCYHQRGDAAHAALMVESAELACVAWRAAGGWLEAERADWQLAMCAAAAGEGALALRAARDCVRACEQQGGDDYEFCFAYQALGLAAVAAGMREQAGTARASMAQRVPLLAAESRGYAERCLAELDAALAAMG